MKRKTEKGAVLLEAIVAIGLLVAIVVAVIGLSVRLSSALRNTSDRLVATYLVQDVIEWMVARESYDQSQGLAFLSWLGGACSFGNQCGINTSGDIPGYTTNIARCADIQDCRLFLSDVYLYGYNRPGYTMSSDDVATQYVRTVELLAAIEDLNTDGTDDEARFRITVTWQTGSGEDSLSVNHTLYAK